MIYLYEHNTAIVTPFKTGSTSIHNHLCGREIGGYYVVGPQGNGVTDKHSTAVPDWGNERRVIVVRNPIRRAESMLSFLRMFHPELTFARFAGWLQTNPICRNLSDLFDESRSHDYWKLEHIDDCLDGLGIPPLQRRDNRSPQKYRFTASQVSSLRWWWEPDAIRFDY